MERKYYVKSAYRTNLDSMHTKLQCIRYDMQEGKYSEVELLGKVYNVDTISDLIDEVEMLIGAAYGKVTGKEYGRIVEISAAREVMRYATCLAHGMSEEDAAYAFL